MHSATLAEWLELLADAEFTVESVELIRKTHELGAWIGRAHAHEGTVRDAWDNAPADIKRQYDVVEDASGAVVSYSDDKAMILAVKPLATQ